MPVEPDTSAFEQHGECGIPILPRQEELGQGERLQSERLGRGFDQINHESLEAWVKGLACRTEDKRGANPDRAREGIGRKGRCGKFHGRLVLDAQGKFRMPREGSGCPGLGGEGQPQTHLEAGNPVAPSVHQT